MLTAKELLAKLGTKKGIDVIIASDMPNVERVSTGLYALDEAVSGGVPVGSATIIEGRYASTKSSLCYKIAGNCVASFGKPTALIHSEPEFGYSKEFAEACGLPLEETIVFNENRINVALDLGLELVRSGDISCLIIDSLAALREEDTMNNVSESQSRGGRAKPLNDFFNKLSGNMNKDSKCVVLCTQHLYQNVNSRYGGYIRSGGEGQGYIAGLIIRLTRNEIGEEEIKAAQGKDTVPTWLLIGWKIEKNKFGANGAMGTYRLYIEDADMPKGTFSEAPDALIKGMLCGLIEKKGAWYIYNGEKFHGESKILPAIDVKSIMSYYKSWRNNSLASKSADGANSDTHSDSMAEEH